MDTKQTTRQQRAEQNRKDMPNVADVIDTFTKFFGPVKVLGAEDFVTGKKQGKL